MTHNSLQARWGNDWLPAQTVKVFDQGEYLVSIMLPLGATMLVRRARRDLRTKPKERHQRQAPAVSTPLFPVAREETTR
ncbi:MAG TPA: hypothetical protein VNA25_30000 [Phycisphaerae bacterium]|nr:hypothetical protein [Phycisphaerae bacterium]